MQFKADKSKSVMCKGRILKFEKGDIVTTDKDEIEALKNAKGVTVVKGKATE